MSIGIGIGVGAPPTLSTGGGAPPGYDFLYAKDENGNYQPVYAKDANGVDQLIIVKVMTE